MNEIKQYKKMQKLSQKRALEIKKISRQNQIKTEELKEPEVEPEPPLPVNFQIYLL